LNKAIYGLKQAPLAWYNRLSTWLLTVGFAISVADPCVFYRLGDNPVWLFIHVDDIAVFGKDISTFKSEIKAEFDMKDMGRADLLLGIKVLHEPSAIILSQLHYVNSLLALYGMTACRPVATPLVPNTQLDRATTEEIDRFNSLGVNYRSAVGALSYLSSATRPDIAHAVSQLSQFLESPGITHWEAFTHVLRYLSGTPDHALVYHRNCSSPLEGYTDADWGNCPATRQSVTGYLSLFNGHLIGWQTKKQPVVSLSSCEAEYRALTDFSCELLWIRQLIVEIGLDDSLVPTIVHEDNQGCIAVANFDANEACGNSTTLHS
jgi:histone deacetylase 1/2